MNTVIMLATLVLAGGSPAAPGSAETTRIAEATRVVEEFTAMPDGGIPDEIWRRAECVAVIPGLKKGALLVGGEFGRGLVSCRAGRGWGAPAFLAMRTVSWGAQVGAEAVDLVLLFLNRNGLDRLLADHLTLGADVSIAAGPVGRAGSAATDARLTAEMFSYSRAQGAFVGLDVSGGVVQPDRDANEDLYGRRTSARDILREPATAAPAPAQPFIAALNRASRSAE